MRYGCRTRQGRELLLGHPFQQVRQTGGIVHGQSEARRQRRLPNALERRDRRVKRVVEVIVHLVLQRLNRDTGGFRPGHEAQRTHGLEPHPRRRVVDCLLQQRQRSVYTIEPELQHTNGGRARAELFGLEKPLQQIDLDDVVVLEDPESFQQVVLVVVVGRIELPDPCPQRRQDFFASPLAQRASRPVARAVLVRLQQLELRLDGLAVDLRPFEQRPALGGDAPHSTVRLVAPGVPYRVLHVPDERVEPVHDVERAVGPELQRDGPEVRVGRLQERFDLDAAEPRPVFDDAVLLGAEKADRVVDQEVALRVVGEVAARDELDAGRRPHARVGPLLNRTLLPRVVDVTRVGRPEVVVAV